MNLSDLTPQKVSFTLLATDIDGNQNEFPIVFRPFTLGDDAWIERKYGTKEKLAEVFSNIDMVEITRIAFHQCTVETKKKIMEVKYCDIDEDGNEIELSTTGPQKLLAMISGFNEGIKLYKKLLEARGISNPVLTEIAKEELKKKGMEPDQDLIGLLSSI